MGIKRGSVNSYASLGRLKQLGMAPVYFVYELASSRARPRGTWRQLDRGMLVFVGVIFVDNRVFSLLYWKTGEAA